VPFTYRIETTDRLSGWRSATTGERLPEESVVIRHDDRVLCTMTGECLGFESARNRAAWIVRLLSSGRTTPDRIPTDADRWTTSNLFAHLTA
jgi:hypothetical protein